MFVCLLGRLCAWQGHGKDAPEPELKAAKQNIVGGFPMRIDSNGKILDYLSLIGFYHLPLTYLDDFNQNVSKVTTAQIKDAFSRRVNPEKMEIKVTEFDPASANIEKEIGIFAGGSDLIVDAIFGTGLTGVLRNDFVRFINAINSLNKPIVAVDIPSGLDCDTGEPLGAAIKAASTVTFAAAKKGFLNLRSAQFTGQVYIASIGIEPEQQK